MKEHVVRMKIELEELQDKIKKAKEFLEKERENPCKTNEQQRINLYCQLQYMEGYAQILDGRIAYDELVKEKE